MSPAVGEILGVGVWSMSNVTGRVLPPELNQLEPIFAPKGATLFSAGDVHAGSC